ncbi:hypothetical protein H2203_000284 [Taxawa tesnikishii (nom. ined.)]|nr:hypothetical protein H2203_000284 [Dothideales sp. JES 119]
MRMTRAAAAAAQIHVDEVDPIQAEELLSHSVQGKEERAPLGEISSNSIDGDLETTSIAPETSTVKKSRGRPKKQDAKKNTNSGSSEEVEATGSQNSGTEDALSDIVPDEHESASSAASDAAVEDLREEAGIHGMKENVALAAMQEASISAMDGQVEENASAEVQQDEAQAQEDEEMPLEQEVQDPVNDQDAVNQTAHEAIPSSRRSTIAPVSSDNIQQMESGGMVFDPQRMCWLKGSIKEDKNGVEVLQDEEEEDVFAGIEDLKEEPCALQEVEENEDAGKTTPAVEADEPILLPKRTPAATPGKTPAKNFQRKELFGMRSTSNKENVEPLSPTVPGSPAMQSAPQVTVASSRDVVTSPMRGSALDSTTPEDPIEAIDALEEAIQEVDASVPKVETMVSPDKSDNTTSAQRKAAARPSSIIKGAPTTNSTKKPTSRPSTTTRASSVRRSIAPRVETVQNTTVKRASSIKKPAARPSVAAEKQPVTKDKAPSGGASDTTEKATVDIPHSKPRPVSLPFPTPPPLQNPPKHLQEAIAAKLKAAKEERLKKESEQTKGGEPAKRVFKARPAPKMDTKPAVRQTSTSRARQSLMPEKEKEDEGMAKNARSRPVRRRRWIKSPWFDRPAQAWQGKSEEAENQNENGVKRANSVVKRPSSMIVPSTTKRLSAVPKTSVVAPKPTVGKPNPSRPSLAQRDINRPSPSALKVAKRSSVVPTANTGMSQRVPSGPAKGTAKGTAKGREVFQRAALEKEKEEKAKREKEEAAKKARAAASERSRQLSREWAEKQKAKMGGAVKRMQGLVLVGHEV